MGWIFNRTGKGDKRFSLGSGIFVTLSGGCGLGYAVSTLEGFWAGAFLGIIILLIPFVILGIYHAYEEFSVRQEEENENLET